MIGKNYKEYRVNYNPDTYGLVAQWMSSGLLNRWMWVRVPSFPPSLLLVRLKETNNQWPVLLIGSGNWTFNPETRSSNLPRVTSFYRIVSRWA